MIKTEYEIYVLIHNHNLDSFKKLCQFFGCDSNNQKDLGLGILWKNLQNRKKRTKNKLGFEGTLFTHQQYLIL